MYKPSILHLETAVWIARLGSYAAAAQRLNTTQPTVSSRIKELEERLGIAVFEKTGRRMVLTVKGRALVDRCAPLLDKMEGVLRSVTDSRDMHGTLRLGCGEIFAVTGLSAITRYAREAFPNVNWEVDVDLTVNLKTKLERAALDLAIMVSPNDLSLRTAKLTQTNLTWTADCMFVHHHGPLHDAADLSRVPVWTLSRPSLQYELTTRCLHEQSQAYRINTCNHVQTLIEIIAAGSGVGMLPDSLLRTDARYSSLVPVFPALDPVPIEFHVAHRRDTSDSLVLEAFEMMMRHAD